MKKLQRAVKYMTFMLFGVFTADMILRFARFIFAYIDAAKDFPKILGVAVSVVGDTYSGYMLFSIIVAALLALSGGVSRVFLRHTLVFFILSVSAGLVFIAILNWVNVPFNLLFPLAIASFGTYMICYVSCEICAALDIYKAITNHNGRKIDDSTT